MSTSGDTTWQLQRDQIIAAALRKVGFAEGETPNATQITNAAEALNAIIAHLRADGMPVWAMKTFSFSTTAGVQDYNIGVGQTINTPMPMKLTQAMRVNTIGGNRVPMNIYTQYDFNQLSNFTSTTGTPVQLYYQPKSTFGTLRLWPIPDATFASGNTIEITYQRPFEEFDTATDEPDFPSYWTRAIIYLLAYDLCPEYGVALPDRKQIQADALMYKLDALGFGTEEGSIRFMPDWIMMNDGHSRGY